MNIYIGLFLFFIAAFIIYRVIKIRNHFRRAISREEKVMQYCNTGVRSWSTAPATLDSAEVQTVAVDGQSQKFKLAIKLTFEVNGQQYVCTQSPYSSLPTALNITATSLRNDVTSSDEHFIYYNPTNPKESFYLFNGFSSWSDYELLLKKPD